MQSRLALLAWLENEDGEFSGSRKRLKNEKQYLKKRELGRTTANGNKSNNTHNQPTTNHQPDVLSTAYLEKTVLSSFLVTVATSIFKELLFFDDGKQNESFT